MSRRVIPKGLIGNQPASKGQTFYFGIGAINRSVRRNILSNALGDPFPSLPKINKIVEAAHQLAIHIVPARRALRQEYSINGGNTWQTAIVTRIGTQDVLQLTGLTNGTTYLISLRGVNHYGIGPSSAVQAGTPNPIGLVQRPNAGTYTQEIPLGVIVNYLLVGGGGGGASAYDTGSSGGGGGGMVLLTGDNAVPFTSQGGIYTIVVGSGGSGGPAITSPTRSEQNGQNGNPSSITGPGVSIIALGGGGGIRSRAANPLGAGGVQAQPPSQRSGGGQGGGNILSTEGSGGGGGAGGPGGNSISGGAGVGGNPKSVSLAGITGVFGKGGAGKANNDSNDLGVSATSAGNGGDGANAASSSSQAGGNGGQGAAWIYY